MDIQKDAFRYDVGQITSVERTPQGFLKIPGFATRTGVFVYRDKNGGIRRELRHPDDVHDPVSLATLKNVPVTLEHPPVMVTPENFKEFACGYTTERVEVNRDLVETDLIVAEEAAIASVESKERRELSCGYRADLIEERGTFNGADYDCRQKNIRYNHLAIVKSGRGGPEIRLRMDSSDAVMDAMPDASSQKKVIFMGEEVDFPSHLADGFQALIDRHDEFKTKVFQMEADLMKKDVDVSQKGVSPKVPEVQGADDGRSAGKKSDADMSPGVKAAKGLDADEEQKKKDAEEKEKKDEEEKAKKDAEEKAKKDADFEKKSDADKVEELKKDLDEKEAKMDALQAKCDAMEAKMDAAASSTLNPHVGAGKVDKNDSKDFQSAVRERVALVRRASGYVSKETAEKFDSMTDSEIRAAAIAARAPKENFKGKSEVYMQVRFDSLPDLEASALTRREMGGSFMARMDSETADPKTARDRMRNDSKKEYETNLSAVKK